MLEATATKLCDGHGAALFAVAVALVRDEERAQRAVVDVISAACVHSQVTRRPADQLRGELVRQLHEYSGGADALQAADGCDRQRYAAALVQHGGLDYREIADLLDVPASEVADWLGAALRSRVRA